MASTSIAYNTFYALTRGIYPPRRNKEVTYGYVYISTERFIRQD